MEGLIIPVTSEYTGRPLNESRRAVRHLSFYCAFTFISISALLLGLSLTQILYKHPQFITLFSMQWLCISSSFMMVGIGLSVPFLMIASILGWGQFVLLLTGNIRPHLGREGFVDVLKILLSNNA